MDYDKIETKIIQINRPTGIWFYASRQLLRGNDLPDTRYNELKLVEWLKRNNSGKISVNDHFDVGKDIIIPKDKYNIAKVVAYRLVDCKVTEIEIEDLKDDDIISVDFHFVINEYKKGYDRGDFRAVGWIDAYANYYNGITVQYNLSSNDNDTMSIQAFSGGGRGSDGFADAPITIGKYNVVSNSKEDYWGLIARDKNPNNDTVEKEGKDQSSIRFHHPGNGISWGCLAVGKEPVDGIYKTIEEKVEAETMWQPIAKLLNMVKENQERLGCVKEQLVDYAAPSLRAINTAFKFKNDMDGRTKERVFGTLTVIAISENANYKIEEMLK